MDMYRETILDHYKHPRNAGRIAKPDASVTLYNTACGDRIVMDVAFGAKGKNQVVADIRFSGEGCAISQASASMLTERVLGSSVSDAMAIAPEDVYAMLGTELTPSRVKCALLPLEALKHVLATKGSTKKAP